jgi:hypothetical protein
MYEFYEIHIYRQLFYSSLIIINASMKHVSFDTKCWKTLKHSRFSDTTEQNNAYVMSTAGRLKFKERVHSEIT